MKIVVCVKHVPDVQSNRSFEHMRIVRGLDDVLNEVDENAVETAVTIAKENDGVEVIALTMGAGDSVDAVKRALQMGADCGVHVCDDRLEGANLLDTGRVLAKAIEKIGDVSMVVTGMASSDGMTSMLPSYLAAFLDMPLLSYVNEINDLGEKIVVSRTIDGYVQKLSASLPVVMSVTDQINEPGYPNFKAIAPARKKNIDIWDLSDLDLDICVGGFISVVDTVEKPAKEKGEILMDSPLAVKQLADFIKERLK